MAGYKTIIASIISMLSGLALIFGLELPPELLDLFRDNVELVVGSIMSLYAVIMSILRVFTKGPIGGQK